MLRLDEHEYKLIEEGIKDAISYLCVKDSTTSIGLDKRRKSTEFIRDSACLPSGACVGKGIRQMQTELAGVQGGINLRRSLPSEYHKNQEKLFIKEGLSDQYDNLDGKLKRKNGHELTVKEFCELINALISQWYKSLCSTGPCLSGTVTHENFERDRQFLQLAVPVPIQRYQMQYHEENDLSTDTGWELWRDHVCVLICFATYCGIIDAHLHEVYSKCGFEAIKERGE